MRPPAGAMWGPTGARRTPPRPMQTPTRLMETPTRSMRPLPGQSVFRPIQSECRRGECGRLQPTSDRRQD